MRARPTDAEALLWSRLRRRQLGFRFRRQEPIGRYIVDFLCWKRKLVVEVDGATHQDQAYDRRRDEYLGHLGFRVLRFWNTEIYENLEGVLEKIWMELHRPSP